MKNPYDTVADFEAAMADFTGSPYAVATDSCTSALFLCAKYLGMGLATFPARTYISAPAAVIHAGGAVRFVDYPWTGWYQLYPYPVWDSALRLYADMFRGGFVCLSFQARKRLPIGRGGMILCESAKASEWFHRARSNGRTYGLPFMNDSIAELGWNFYMTPEEASRGMMLLGNVHKDAPDLDFEYPDLRLMPAFKEKNESPDNR